MCDVSVPKDRERPCNVGCLDCVGIIVIVRVGLIHRVPAEDGRSSGSPESLICCCVSGEIRAHQTYGPCCIHSFHRWRPRQKDGAVKESNDRKDGTHTQQPPLYTPFPPSSRNAPHQGLTGSCALRGIITGYPSSSGLHVDLVGLRSRLYLLEIRSGDTASGEECNGMNKMK